MSMNISSNFFNSMLGTSSSNSSSGLMGLLSDYNSIRNGSYLKLAKQMEQIGVRYIVFTDISKDGTLSGPNLNQLAAINKAVSCNIIARGGICDIGDIQALKELGVYGAICGKSLYKGTLELKDALAIGMQTE